MHKCTYNQRFSIIDGKLTHCVVAMWKNYSLEVYRRDEDGIRTRNFYYNYMAGYSVSFPGEKLCYDYVQRLDEWENAGKIRPYFGDDVPTEYDKEKVCRIYPDFKYIFQKCDLSYSEVMELIPIWKEHPQVELLLANGWKMVAFNRSFYKMRKENIKRLLMTMRDYIGKDFSLSDFKKLGAGWTPETLRLEWIFRRNQCRPNLDQAKYIVRNEGVVNAYEYMDYVRMATRAGHDMEDPYWYAPSDFKKRHQKVIRECRRIDRLEDRKKAEEKQGAYEKAVKKMFGKVADIGTLSVYVPETCLEIQKHADKLHQCLVTADYIGKVAKGECVLVFITENGKPLATAELKPARGKKYKLGQFYGDERKTDYLAPERAKEALNEWAVKFNYKISA